MRAHASEGPAAPDLDVLPDVSAPPPIGTERMRGRGLKDEEVKCGKLIQFDSEEQKMYYNAKQKC